MKKNIFVANWKMNGSTSMLESYFKEIKEGLGKSTQGNEADLIICPPSIYIKQAARLATQAEALLESMITNNGKGSSTKTRGPSIYIGGQAFSHEKGNGAHTGSISAEMLKDAGCTYGIVAHSEARTAMRYTGEQISNMVVTALSNAIVPIICFGKLERDTKITARLVAEEASEILEKSWDKWQKVAGSSANVATATPKSALHSLHISRSGKSGKTQNGGSGLLQATRRDASEKGQSSSPVQGEIVIAYEPIWSIGSGELPTQEHIQEVASRLGEVSGKVSEFNYRLIYGGSVSISNIQELMSIPYLNGVMVGGASLIAGDVASMIKMMSQTPATNLRIPQKSFRATAKE